MSTQDNTESPVKSPQTEDTLKESALLVWDGKRWVTWTEWQNRQLDRIFGRSLGERTRRVFR